jgi:hypothetical protein
VVADAVEGLDAQVERGECDVGTPLGVVEPTLDVDAERILAGVAAGPVPAVVTEGDRLGERYVQPEGAGDRAGHLGDLESMGETGSLVVVREDEDLRLAGQPPEGGRVQDAVAVALEAGAPGVGRFLDRPVPCAVRPRRQGGEGSVLVGLAVCALDQGW